MSAFIIDLNKTYKYSDLLGYVNSTDSYYDVFRTNDLFSFYANLIKCVVSNQSITLVDSDIQNYELKTLSLENSVNHRVVLQKSSFTNIEELRRIFLQSSSEITLFTSGTTGQPKKIAHSIQTLLRNIRVDKKYSKNIWGLAYNPAHMAGLQVFLQAFLNGNTLVNIFNLTRDDVYDEMEKNQITHISATPTFYRLLMPPKEIISSVSRITLGGEKSDTRLLENIGKVFPNAKINNIYASTEAGALFSTSGEIFRIPQNIADKVMIQDGELLIHRSLLGKSDLLLIEKDFYNTGDLVEWVDYTNGLFRFLSRKNELINIGGYKVNPSEVENIICKLEGVEHAVVFGKANSVLGNILCADIIISSNSNLKEEDIRSFLADNLQDFKIPRRIKFVEKLTLTRTGKIKR
ncbi:MAG: fatty acid--CoA ligase family protein [Bacteroidales bacterium]